MVIEAAGMYPVGFDAGGICEISEEDFTYQARLMRELGLSTKITHAGYMGAGSPDERRAHTRCCRSRCGASAPRHPGYPPHVAIAPRLWRDPLAHADYTAFVSS